MSRLYPLLTLLPLILIGCGMSDEEKQSIAAVTCSVMGETRNMDSAVRVREINNARKELGEPVYLGGDDGIQKSFEYGLCESLVLNSDYDSQLAALKRLEAERIAEARRQEKARLAEWIASQPTKWENFKNSALNGTGQRVFTFECDEHQTGGREHRKYEDITVVIDLENRTIKSSLVDFQWKGGIFSREKQHLRPEWKVRDHLDFGRLYERNMDREGGAWVRVENDWSFMVAIQEKDFFQKDVFHLDCTITEGL
jgi:hypothetical protein